MTHHHLHLVLVVVAVSLSHSPARAGLCVPPTVEKDSPYYYLVSLVDSLRYAKAALDRTSPATLGSEPTVLKMLVGLKLAKADYDCARSQVAPYSASSNGDIKTSAEGAATVFSRLVDLDKATVAGYKALLDSAAQGRPLKPSSVLESQAELAARYDETWKYLVPAVAAGADAVVEVEPATGRASRLALTRAQRDDILQKLQSTFGDEVKGGMRGGQRPLIATAAMLYESLVDARWKLRDSK